jgi:hypothetical protein
VRPPEGSFLNGFSLEQKKCSGGAKLFWTRRCHFSAEMQNFAIFSAKMLTKYNIWPLGECYDYHFLSIRQFCAKKLTFFLKNKDIMIFLPK